MKPLFTLVAIIAFSFSSIAQNCTPTISVQKVPYQNNLLQYHVIANTANTNHNFKNKIYWGDGVTSSSFGNYTQHTHNYNTAGTYTIKYVRTYYDSLNNIIYCKDSTTQTINAQYDTCATSLTMSISPNHSGKVTFTANTPSNYQGIIYHWNFHDGTTKTTWNNTITHTYFSGSRSVTLTASTNNCSYTNFLSFSISNNCGKGHMQITSNGLNHQFMNYSSKSNGVTISSQWDFGDGNTSNSLNANHTYQSNGQYTTKLIVTWRDSILNTVLCTDTLHQNFYAQSSSNIIGYIKKDSTKSPINPIYKIWLIKYDSTTKILSAIDSLIVQNSANLSSTIYSFANVPSGLYRIKAAITNGASSGIGFVPTYHDSSLMWNNALTISHQSSSSGISNSFANIYLKTGMLTSGPGFVGGNVTQGANKGTANGIAKMNVFLLDNNNDLVQSTVTDASGSYSFSNLPNGNYSVYPENLGDITTPAMVTITGTNTNVSNIAFERSASKKTIKPIALNINNINNTASTFTVYPNPTQGAITIETNTPNTIILITDITGKSVFSASNTKFITPLDLNHLQKGLYFITISADNKRETQKLLIQ